MVFVQILGTIINIVYDKNTNIIKGPGIELAGFQNTLMPVTSVKNDLLLQDIQFVPYHNPQTQVKHDFYKIFKWLNLYFYRMCGGLFLEH